MKKILLFMGILALVAINFTSCSKKDSDKKSTDHKENFKTGLFTVNGVSFNMVKVDGGSFTMGEQGSDADSDEKSAHEVTLSDYMIGETEVTQELWNAVMDNNPSNFSDDPQRPVDNVSWEDCVDFIDKLNSLTGQTFRLPTEAEWEYAASGGNKSKGYMYAGSNTLDDVAWHNRNSYNKGKSSPDYGTHAVKTKLPNELGLYDMSGNVIEWCNDFSESYSSGSQTNPKDIIPGSLHAIRGGGWDCSPGSCSVSNSDGQTSDFRNIDLGLRLAL